MDGTDPPSISKGFAEVKKQQTERFSAWNSPTPHPIPKTDGNWGEPGPGARLSSTHSRKIAWIYCTQRSKSRTHTLKAQEAGETHILHYQMLDTTRWQSILGTKSFAGLHLSSSAILSYCCVSAHKHLQAKENTLFLETLLLFLKGMKSIHKDRGKQIWMLKLLTDWTFLILKGRRSYCARCCSTLLVSQQNYYCLLNYFLSGRVQN